jgi:penicillin amidase
MAPYRAERIRDLLAKSDRLNVEEMKKLQFDIYSPQGARFMAILQPLLQSFEKKRFQFCSLLSLWNHQYDQDSLGACLFERTYRALLREVFSGEGANSLGTQVTDHLYDRTSLITDFYGNFDRIMLADASAWFGGRAREEVYAKALEAALSEKPEPYGKGHRILMKHLVFGGKLPRWFGFDRGPVPLLGNRSTVHQGQIFRVGSRETTFGPSLRIVTDLATDEMHTSLPGGASDRRFSKWYANEIEDWLKGRYKLLHG